MKTVYYHTGWNPCYIHIMYEGTWKSLKMSPHDTRLGWQQISLEEINEFVFNNGNGQWDNPSPGCNYKNPGCRVLAVYGGKEIPVDPASPIILVSDLDNTLIGSFPDTKAAQRRFNEYWISKHYFGQSKLVYNTGRSLEEFLDLYKQGYKLLDPDMLVTAVGSNAYTLDKKTGLFVSHVDYHHLYDGECWDSYVVDKVLRENFPWVHIPEKQHIYPFKVWVTAEVSYVNENKQYLRSFLKNPNNEVWDGKVIHARTIISGSGGWRYIDIVPRIGGKRMGIIYAQKYFKFPPSRTIVAGDSGNDIEMFRDEHYGILVENAEEEMNQWFFKKNRTNKFKSAYKWADAIVDGIERVFYRDN
jgi:sucrose-6-phosphatase